MNMVKGSSLAFLHDHCFLMGSDGTVYSEGKITDKVLERFYSLADEIVIVSRLRKVEDISGLVPLIDPRIRMSPVRGTSFVDIFGKWLFTNLAHVWREFGSVRFVVLRMPSLLSFIAAPVLWLRSVPYSVEIVGFPRDGLAGKGNRITIRFLGVILHILMAWVTRRANGALYVTQAALQSVFPTKGLQVAVSNVELRHHPVEMPLKSMKPLNNPPRIGLIGGMSTNYKGIDVGIRAISQLSKQGYSCVLHVLGSGDSEPLRQLAKELECSNLVVFDGIRQGGVGVTKWLDDLDIYIQPSRTEGLPRALIEAMSRGLPAIATRVGGIPELLDDQWLVPPGEPEPLAERLKLMISFDALRDQARKANVRCALDYSEDVLRKRRNDFYNALAHLIDAA
jgi:glycosyltransferase involved in cell wall biosynthesis